MYVYSNGLLCIFITTKMPLFLPPCLRPTHLAGQTESEKQLDVVFTVLSNIAIGEDFTVKVSVVNKGTTSRQFKFRLMGRAMFYTGASGQVVQALDEERFTLQGGESKLPKLLACTECSTLSVL